MAQIINVQEVTKNVSLGNGKRLEILHDISLSADAGEFISIVGPSGAGKSTLLKVMSGLLPPTSGRITLFGLDPYNLRANKAAKLRRNQIGFIFQNYNLIPALPAFDNIVLPLRLAHKGIHKARIYQLLKEINFEASPNSFISSLSGGEQQKVAIARVLIANSKIIFADEPTGALDTTSGKIIFNLLRKLVNRGACVVMVTHDIELAASADKAIILRDGQLERVIQDPTVEAIFKSLDTEGR